MGPSGRSFGPDDVEVLSVVGRRVAVSVENAQLYERVRRQSHTLQRALLPDDLPEDDWFDVAGRYRPGTDGDEVGGDWYDAHYSETGELTFTIGDVAGRGLEAAAVMGQLRSAIAALELDRHGPAVVLDRLDRVRTRNDSHATVLYGSLAKDGRLRYSSAGHLPPVVITAGGASILPTKPAPPVGMRTHVGARLHEHFLARGDAVVLYTDGLIERRGQLIDDGLARLQQAASSMAEATAAEIADGLLHALITDDCDDDVALLALKFRG
jgi:serine phosphatase RsbU (regulator of sigma subunit)